MASSASNVYAAMPKATGSLLRAPLGTTLPTNATSEVDDAFVDLGYIGEDGFTESNSRDVEKKKAFGGVTVKVLQTDYTATVSFTFMESINADVLRAVYGDQNVQVDGEDITVRKNKSTLPHASWVIDTLDGEGSIRTVVPDGQIISIEDIQKVHTDTIGYTVTIEAFENAQGDNILEYINNPSSGNGGGPGDGGDGGDNGDD